MAFHLPVLTPPTRESAPAHDSGDSRVPFPTDFVQAKDLQLILISAPDSLSSLLNKRVQVDMILLQAPSRFLLQILLNRIQNPDKLVEVDCHSVEFDDVRYHTQFSPKSPQFLLLSVSLPTPPPETIFFGGLPFGAIEAVKAAYGAVVQILDPPKDGFNLTMKINLTKLPSDEEKQHSFSAKLASVREVVLGAPLRVILNHLTSRTVAPDVDRLVALVHRPKESFFVVPQADKVTLIYPMRFKDPIDVVLATSFLLVLRGTSVYCLIQKFVEARRTTGMNNAPPCQWSASPPLELKGAPAQALTANAGFVTIVIFPRDVEGRKLDRTVWSLLTFHAYVSYHVKVGPAKHLLSPSLQYMNDALSRLHPYETPCFVHTRMRRRVESLIQALDRAKPDPDKLRKTAVARSFKRLNLKDGRSNSS